jgi:hypothetical protein
MQRFDGLSVGGELGVVGHKMMVSAALPETNLAGKYMEIIPGCFGAAF